MSDIKVGRIAFGPPVNPAELRRIVSAGPVLRVADSAEIAAAASEIERLRAENARLRDVLTEISRDAWAMEAQTDEPLTGTYAKSVGERADAALAAQREEPTR